MNDFIRKAKEDTGHFELTKDLVEIMDLTGKFAYHDFKSNYDSPKVELRNRLLKMVKSVEEGKYDN